MLDFGLKDKTIVVTGGASGIGRAVSDLAARQGMSVAVLDLNEEAVTSTVKEIEDSGGRAAPFVVDVRDRSAVRGAVADIEGSLGPIHGAVACAGISRPALAEELSPEDWAAVIDINLTGAFTTAQAVGERMLTRGAGSIVVIGSTDSLGGHSQRASYAASKHGVAGMVKSMAIDWGRRGVRVNAVAPGVVDTPLMHKLHTDESINTTFLVRVPLGRLATGRDQANACLFLLSDAASYVSGTVLAVDGGLTAGYFNHLPVDS